MSWIKNLFKKKEILKVNGVKEGYYYQIGSYVWRVYRIERDRREIGSIKRVCLDRRDAAGLHWIETTIESMGYYQRIITGDEIIDRVLKKYYEV